MRRLTVIVVALVAGAGLAVVGLRHTGVLCRDSVTGYAHEPMPAPRLEDGAVLHVGERRSVGGYSDPLRRAPIVVGGAESVRAERAEFPTRARCGRMVGGYRYLVVTAMKPGSVKVAVVTYDGVERTRTASVIA